METLAALASLAPYGIGPAIAGYGAYRGARSFGKAALRSLPPRKKMRIPRMISARGQHKIRRSVTIVIPYSPLNGFTVGGGTGQNLNFGYSLSAISMLCGGATSTLAVPNSTQMSTLFDKWRISSVRAQIYFQDNSSTTSVNTTNMPLLNYVWDTSDNAVEALSDMLSHDKCRRYQFGNGAAKGGCLRTSGRPQATLGTGDLLLGGTTTGSHVEPRATWFQTTTPNVLHNCLKIVADPIGATLATSEGSFSFYFDIMYDLKDII